MENLAVAIFGYSIGLSGTSLKSLEIPGLFKGGFFISLLEVCLM